jgi:DNA-binding Lrp family transcriptional regulator
MFNSPKLDRIDINILAELQRSGRITNAELSDRVGLSPSPCLARVKRLEAAGYISGYSAIINLNKIGNNQIVFSSMTLSDHRRADFVKFEQAIARYDELVECHLVSGGFDYLLKFVVRGIDQYQEMMEEILESGIGVSKYFSYIVIKTAVARGQPSVKLHLPATTGPTGSSRSA